MTRNIRVAVVHPKTVYGCLICEFRLIDSSSQSRLGTFDRLFLLSRISCNWLNLEKYLVGICEMAFLSKDNSRNVVFIGWIAGLVDNLFPCKTSFWRCFSPQNATG